MLEYEAELPFAALFRFGGFGMDRVPITPEGFQRLEEELRRLKATTAQRSSVPSRKRARTAIYQRMPSITRPKTSRPFIEGRIAELEDKTSRAEIIDPASMAGSTASVKFGATVEIL